MFVGIVNRVPELFALHHVAAAQGPHHDALIRDGRYDIGRQFEGFAGALQNAPRIVARFQSIHRVDERKPAGQRLRAHPEQSRLLREVEVEAVRLIAVAQPERHEAHVLQDLFVEVVKILPVGGVVHVVNDGDAGFAH